MKRNPPPTLSAPLGLPLAAWNFYSQKSSSPFKTAVGNAKDWVGGSTGCIMHQVHTSLCIFYNAFLLDVSAWILQTCWQRMMRTYVISDTSTIGFWNMKSNPKQFTTLSLCNLGCHDFLTWRPPNIAFILQELVYGLSDSSVSGAVAKSLLLMS